jgi:hypothetical protein
MKIFSFAAAGMLCASAFQLCAQTPADPPAVLRIIREDIKEGKEAAHRNNENTFMLEAALAKYPAHVLGMTSITGAGQAWFLEGHESFEAVEKTLSAFGNSDAKFAQIDELDAEYRTSSRSWLAAYRPDMSYRPEDWMQNLPKARFFNIAIIHVQSGHDQDFAEVSRLTVDAARKALDDQPWVMYEVVSGLPSGTYLVFQPSVSLKSLDVRDQRSRTILQAMGDTAAKHFTKTIGDAVASQESLLFSLEPRMSYVSREFAAADPDFWNPKTEPAARPKAHGKAAAKASGN